LSLSETIRILAELAKEPSRVDVREREFEEALERFCSGMKGIEAGEVMELRRAIGAMDAEG